MRNLYCFLLSFALCMLFSDKISAQQSFFADVQESSFDVKGKRTIIPLKYRTLNSETGQLRNFLWSLPSESSLLNRNLAPQIVLPLPDGTAGRFRIWESSIQEPGLQALFPEIRTFCGQGVDDPYATVRIDFNPDFGFHAQILTVNGDFYLDPYSRNDIDHYISYYRKDLKRAPGFTCLFNEKNSYQARPGEIMAGPCRGTTLKTYRLAVACTGEYAQAVGATTLSALHAAIVTSVNRVTGVYEKEISVRLILVSNNQTIEFLNPNTDPFNGNNSANTLIGESQSVISGRIGPMNFDFGHTFSTGGGGLAGLGVVCDDASKARGITGSPLPVGDGYDIDFVAHEMGHQLGAEHTFNSNTFECFLNRESTTAYEVGSGTTIMGYAGLCSTDDIQNSSDPFFHAISFDQISIFINSEGTCGVNTSTGNTLPVITSLNLPSSSIPLNTPFTLSGTATDADGDALSYCWEEWDLGSATAWNRGNDNTTSPLFKSRIPKTSGSRTFPDIDYIKVNYLPAVPDPIMGGLKGETRPTRARTMKFRLTVRDNRAGGGGVVSAGGGCQTGFTGNYTVNTVTGSGPFVVTYPNGGESFQGASTVTATWSVARTNLAPINTTKVRILMSTDGGTTYPLVLLDSTDNDGSADVIMPLVQTSTARIRIEAIRNIFFDISNANFTITQPIPTFIFNAVTLAYTACGGPDTASVSLGTTAINGFTTPINLSATGNPAGTTVSFSNNSISPGGSSLVTLKNIDTLPPGTYSFTVTGVAGAVTKTATISYEIRPGAGPAFLSQPSNAVICDGNNASFATSTSSALSYQWQVSTDGGATWNNINNDPVYGGAQTNTLNLTSPSSGFNGYSYRLNAVDFCGNSNSSVVTLTVNQPAAISSGPQNVTACEVLSHTFSVTATGSGLTYQWQQSTDGCFTYNNIPGATSSNYVIPVVTSSMSGSCYRVIVNGICPGGPLTSAPATLLTASATSITQQPSNLTVCAGEPAVFSAGITGGINSLQWQVSTNGGISFSDLPGENSNTLSLTSASISQNNNRYRIIINGCAASPIVSNSATLTVNSLVNISIQPGNASTCSGNSSFLVQASGSNLTYQWQISTDGGSNWSNLTNDATYNGTTNATLFITGANSTFNGNIYRVKVFGSCNVDGVASGSVSLTVNTPITISSPPSDFSICLSSPSTASFSVTASGSGLTYQWQVSTNGGATWTNISGANASTFVIPNLTIGLNGNRYRAVLSGSCTSNLGSASALLTVTSPAIINNQPAPTVVACVDGPAVFSVDASFISAYQWQESTNGGNTYNNIAGATNATYTLRPVQNSQNGNRYRVQVTGSNCGSLNSEASVLSIGASHNVTIAAGGNTQITPSSPVELSSSVTPSGNYSYQWYYNGTALPNETDVKISVNAGNLGNYEVRVFNPVTNCLDTSNNISITAAPSNDLFVYPNPNNGRFNVSYYSSSSSGVSRTITIYDSKGARVYSKLESISGPYQLMNINMPNVSAGVYMIDLRDASGKRLATGKVLIQ